MLYANTSNLLFFSKVKVCGGEGSENRLVDDGFAKICDMLNDSSVRVRAEAAGLLVYMTRFFFLLKAFHHALLI